MIAVMKRVVVAAMIAACGHRDPPASQNHDAMTAASYATSILTLESCPLTGYVIDPACPAKLALGKLPPPPDPEATGGFLMLNRSPAIRIAGVELIATAHGAARVRLIAGIAMHEPDPGVLAAMIRVVAPAGGSDAGVAQLLLAVADHAAPSVRLQAVYALASPWNRGVAGGPAKLVTIADGDPDARVREAACESAGALGDPTLLPMYERHTAPTEPPAMRAACLAGLALMFHRDPQFDTHDAGAYALFVRRLGETPRTPDRTPWRAVGVFHHAHPPGDAWFDRAAVSHTLVAIVDDRAAGWQARTAAVGSLVGLGATRAELAAIAARYATPTGDDALVAKAVAEADAKLTSP